MPLTDYQIALRSSATAEENAAVDSPPEIGLWEIDNEGYHADTSAVSHTMLEDFRGSQLDYRNLYVTKTKKRKPPTAALRLGQAVHCMLFEPDRYDELVVIFSETKTLESKAGAEFVEAHPGKTILTADQSVHVVPMVKSVLGHPKIEELMKEGGMREQGVVAQHPHTGLLLKCKPDFLTETFEGNLKTSRNPGPDDWARDAANLGYARGAAHYQDVIRWGLGWDVKTVYFVVQNEPDYECACYYIDDEDVEHGRRQNERKFAELAECYETGEWRAVQNREILKVALPRWSRYEL